ncbi:MAG: glycosyltransferase family 4 protein [Lachnospiraceae bacterium]|jgi:glycosyltransferase involved in cell wall biosynthesis|nr:glycosyltransferase family 4 protein [Lachnospiraceae bacterium]
MNILIVSQYFYPENFRINDLAVELKKRGHHITVLTGIPNYPQGEFYKGYSTKKRRGEEYKGIKVLRAWMLPRHKGAFFLLLNYISFVWGGFLKVKRMRDTDFDLIYAFGTSPITQALPAIVMKKRIHKPLIFNVQDLWPENVVVVTGLKNKVVLGLLEKLVDYIYSYCDLVLVPSKSFVRKIQRRKNFMPKEKVCFWPQYSVVEKASHIPERTGEFGNKKELYDIRKHWDKKKFHIVFTGNIGVAQGLDLVAKAASYLKDSPIVWHLVGGGREKEQVIEAVKKEGVENHVFFYTAVEESLVPIILREADAALIIMKADPILDMTIPAKFQTYLACGCALLGCVNGEVKEYIEESGLGIVSRGIDAKSLAEAAERMYHLGEEERQNFRERALTFSEENFEKEKILSYLEKEFQKQRM